MKVRFRDAFMANYTVNLVDQNNNIVSRSTSTGLRLSRENTDYQYFYKRYLVCVNGYYHRIDTDFTNGILVKDGMKSCKISNQNQIGILSFKEIGDIKTLSFTNDTINTYNNGSVRFTINESLVNKTVMVSIGGYLRYIDTNSFYQVSDNVFKLDFNNMLFRDMFYESKRYIDLSMLPVTYYPSNSDVITNESLLGDSNLIAYLLLSQSFIIIIDNNNLETNKKYVRNSNLIDMYISHIKPEYPLVTGLGRHNVYWYRKEDKQYSINVVESYVNNMLYATTNQNNLDVIGGTRLPDNPTFKSKAYFLEIKK